ncbi:stage II sporulation protein M [Streptomyces sp. TLI_171]|uniref:stage II sporulation protein M n=1 Tax=Streptomyces sp. TLI_171 TaxID=1938859 RepID=UPI000C18FB16|nr:stage II sporulation protein M [Streptomyces sp. TLI_171]RKE19335.1 putative membrane protein SpoIIM required for sporulation [Streptomyces sp. TLI_171]
MDLDVFVAAHQAEWHRLEVLSGRHRLTGEESDELITLYQRATAHLAQVQATAPNAGVEGRLTTLVVRARNAVTGARKASWRDAARYFTASFPATLYRARHWWLTVSVLSFAATAVVAWWIGTDAEVRNSFFPPETLAEATKPGGLYEAYYTEHPSANFAFKVWTNNAWAAAYALMSAALLGVPVLAILWTNIVNGGVGIGLMASAGRLDTFLAMLVPHGLLELTAFFVACGLSLRLGWTVVDPGPRTRAVALAEEGRAVVGAVIGIAAVLFVTGIIEGFVSGSALPAWSRVTIGITVEVLFLVYALVLGKHAAARGETGDVDAGDRTDHQPMAA